ncbi:MAG: FlgD immunoglobulin-like domain containing protein, partial [Paracoccaceae bacterium]
LTVGNGERKWVGPKRLLFKQSLNPVDSADYAMQLAAFSTVEQQVLLNQKMDMLQNNLRQNTLASLSAWIGKTVKLPGSFTYSGGEVTALITPPTGSEKTDFIVRDAAGTDIFRHRLGAQDQEFSWAGTTSEGSIAPVGPYNFALEGFAKDQSLGVSELASLQTIEEIAQPADDILVTLENGQALPWKSLTGLR